ncbi:MAG: isochorismatase family protein, partial [Clostridium sp.]
VFYVKHVNIRKNVAFFIPKTSGIDIYKDVYPQDDEDVIIKHTPDSFFETSLRSKLADKNISHLVVCGMMTHMCIDTTVRSAKNFDYAVTLIEDACTTMDLIWKDNKIPAATVHETFMSALNGTFAEIQTADEWIEKMSEFQL